MANSLSKVIALTVAVSVFATQVVMARPAENSIWNDRKNHPLLAGLPSTLNPVTGISIAPALAKGVTSQSIRSQNHAIKSTTLRILVESVSSAHATVKDIFDSPSETPPLLLIQDIHLNSEAQSNIAAVLQHLVDLNMVGRIGVEGAFQEFDFGRFRAIPDVHIRKKVAQAFLEMKEMGAPSFVGITSPSELPPMTGIDDETHYNANVTALLEGQKLQPKIEKKIHDLKRQLTEQKTRFYSKNLLGFDQLRNRYQENTIGTGAYTEQLLTTYPISAPAHLNQFLEAYRLEKSMNFDRVARERSQLIQKLSPRLNDNSTNALLDMSIKFKNGHVGFGDYYRFLTDVCEKHGVPLRHYPAMERYIRYVMLADQINGETIFDDLHKLEKTILTSLNINQQEQAIWDQDDFLTLAHKLVRFELTPKEWEGLQSMDYRRWSIDHKNLRTFEDFYREADIRSEKMTENILGHHERSVPSHDSYPPRDVPAKISMERYEGSLSNVAPDDKPSVLVVGGFHTPLITQELRKRNVPYAVVTPRLTKIDVEGGTAYLSIFSREKTPLDKFLLGEKLFINPIGQTVGSGAIDTQPVARKLAVLMASLFALGGKPVPGETGVVIDSQSPQGVDATVDGRSVTLYANETSISETPIQNIHIEPRISVGSIWDKWAKNKWGAKSFMYRFYTIILVNWEFVFQAPIYLMSNLVDFGWSTALWFGVIGFIFSAWFAFAHDFKSGHHVTLLFFLHVALSSSMMIPDVQNYFKWLSFIIPMILHSTYNSLALIFGWPVASIKGTKHSKQSLIEFLKEQTSIASDVYWKKTIADIVSHQFSSPTRALVEAVTNSIDAHAETINVEIQGNTMTIDDNGDGLSFDDIQNKLLTPKTTDKYTVDSAIGMFGVGFYSLLYFLKEDGQNITLITQKNGVCHEVMLVKNGADYDLHINKLATSHPRHRFSRGTQIKLNGTFIGFQAEQLGFELAKSQRFQGRAAIFLKFNNQGNTRVNQISELQKLSSIETDEGKATMSYTRPSASQGRVTVTVLGSTVLDVDIVAPQAFEDLVIDIPLKKAVPRARNTLELNDEVISIFENLTREALHLEEAELRYLTINSLYVLFEYLESPLQSRHLRNYLFENLLQNLNENDRILPLEDSLKKAQGVVFLAPTLFGEFLNSDDGRKHIDLEIIEGQEFVVAKGLAASSPVVYAVTTDYNRYVFVLNEARRPQNAVEKALLLSQCKVMRESFKSSELALIAPIQRDELFTFNINEIDFESIIILRKTLLGWFRSKIRRIFIFINNSTQSLQSLVVNIQNNIKRWAEYRRFQNQFRLPGSKINLRLSWLPLIIFEDGEFQLQNLLKTIKKINRGQKALNINGLRHMQGSIRSAIQHQNTDSMACVKENGQNVLDEVARKRKTNPSFQGTLDITTEEMHIGDEDILTVSFADNIGMNAETFFRDLLIPGVSSKNGSTDYRGQFGNGFQTNLKGSRKVAVTTSLGDGQVLKSILTPLFGPDGEIIDVQIEVAIVNENRPAGTTITNYYAHKTMKEASDQKTTAIGGTHMYLGLLPPSIIRVKVNDQLINENNLGEKTNQLAQIATPYGPLSFFKRDAPYFTVTHRMIPLGMFETGSDQLLISPLRNGFKSALPKLISDFLKSRGLVLDLPEQLKLIGDRSDLVDRDNVVAELQPYIFTGVLTAVAQLIAEGDTRFARFLPYDFATTPYNIPQEIQAMAKSLSEGKTTEIDWNLLRSDENTGLLLFAIPIWNGLSLHDISKKCQSPRDGDAFRETLPPLIRSYFETKQVESGLSTERQAEDMRKEGIKTIGMIATRAISDPRAYVFSAFASWTRYILTELHNLSVSTPALTPKRGNKSYGEIDVLYVAMADGTMARAPQGGAYIKINIAESSVQKLLRSFQDVLDSPDKNWDDHLEDLVQILDTLTHELRHLEEGSIHTSRLTHDSNFYAGQLELLRLLGQPGFAQKILTKLDEIRSSIQRPADKTAPFTVAEYVDHWKNISGSPAQVAQPNAFVEESHDSTSLVLPLWRPVLKLFGLGAWFDYSLFRYWIAPVLEYFVFTGIIYGLHQIPFIGLGQAILLTVFLFPILHGNFSPKVLAWRFLGSIMMGMLISMGLMSIDVKILSYSDFHSIISLFSIPFHTVWNAIDEQIKIKKKTRTNEKGRTKEDWKKQRPQLPTKYPSTRAKAPVNPKPKNKLQQESKIVLPKHLRSDDNQWNTYIDVTQDLWDMANTPDKPKNEYEFEYENELESIINETPLNLGVDRVDLKKVSLSQWHSHSRTIAEKTTEWSREDIQLPNTQYLHAMWKVFSALLRHHLTKEKFQMDLIASSLEGLILETARLKQPVLQYLVIKETDPQKVISQLKDLMTILKNQETHFVRLGLAIEDEKVLKTVEEKFSAEIKNGLLHTQTWTDDVLMMGLIHESGPRLSTATSETISREFMEKARFQVFLPNGFNNQGFLDGVDEQTKQRTELYLILMGIMAIQFRPGDLGDNLNRLRETLKHA